MVRTLASTVVLALTVGSLVIPAQRFTPAEGADPLHVPLDQILDVNVRDGLVYYRALKSDRGRLDRYIASLNVPAPTYAGWSREQQMAFWLNAYNAFVLETVIDNYPIRAQHDDLSGRQHPADSRRVRADQAPRRRAQRDARRDREDHPAGVQGAAALSSRSAAAPSAAAGCAARPTPPSG